MKFSTTIAAATLLTVSLGLAGCSGDDKPATGSGSTAAATKSASKSAGAPTPTAADLNAILTKASDPAISTNEKTQTVQNGESAPEIFDTMAKSKQESGANFQVVDPILPGYTPDSVLATVNFTIPNRAPQTAENVEFIHENGTWKLSQSWACTLIKNTVAPEQVPPMCAGQG